MIKMPDHEALKTSEITSWMIFEVGTPDVWLQLNYKDGSKKKLIGNDAIQAEIEIINNLHNARTNQENSGKD